jgi:hypothetical protein
VTHKTKRMNAPSSMPPGISMRRAARTRIMTRKIMVRPPVTTAKVNSLRERGLVYFLRRSGMMDIPWNADSQLLLDRYEPGVDAQDCRCAC